MDPSDLTLLNQHKIKLITDMSTLPVVQYLVSLSVLNDKQAWDIKTKARQIDRNGELLRVLKTTDSSAFDIFVEALHVTNQQQLARLLQKQDQPKCASLENGLAISQAHTLDIRAMDPNDLALLNQHKIKLITDMDTRPVVKYLVSLSVLSDKQAWDIKTKSRQIDSNGELLRVLKMAGGSAFDTFVEALHVTNQQQLAKLLQKQDQSKYILDENNLATTQAQPSNENIRLLQKQDQPKSIPVQKTQATYQAQPSNDNIRQLILRAILEELQQNTCSIEEWEKGEFQGSGSFGDVYKCTNRANGQEIAGKYIRIALPAVNMLPKEKLIIQKDIEPVLREVGIMEKLNHERILKCFGYQTTDISLVVFTELMSNGSVLDEIRRNGAALDLYSTLKYLKQAAEGLLYIHRQGANLLLDDESNVKLADFGISVEIRLKNGLTSSTFTENGNGGIKGTLLHMAPEVVQSKIFTRKSDIWSMGCSVVEMLTTMAPHQDTTEGWDTSKFILQAGLGNLKYVGRELCPNASAEIQILLDRIFQLMELRLTTEQLLVEATLLFVTLF